MKKASLIVTILFVLSLTLAACAPAAPATEAPVVATEAPVVATDVPAATEAPIEDVTLTVWTLNSRNAGITAILDGFMAAYPNITLEVSYNDAAPHRDGLRIAATSGTLPSIWMNWGGTLGGYYAQNNLSYDLTEYAAANNWSAKFEQAAIDLSTLDGQLAGYPSALSVVGVIYRKDVFERLGIAIPETLEELEAACATIKADGLNPISTASGADGYHVMRIVEQLIETYAGPELHDAINTYKEPFNSLAVVQALDKYKEFVDNGYFNEGFVSAGATDAPTKLYSGTDSVMVVEGQWFETNAKKAEIDTTAFGFFPFPSGGTKRMSAFVEMYQFNANLSDAELDAAVKFMDYYYSKEAVAAEPANYKFPLPMTGIADIPEANVITKAMVEAAAAGGTFTIGDQAFPTEVAQVLFSVQDEIALGTMSPVEGAAAVQEAIDTYLANK